jgi:hypothetical protein
MTRYTTPRTVSEALDKAGNLSAKVINKPLSGAHAVAARRCLATIKKVKQVAIIVGGAHPKLWVGDVRAARIGYCPTGNASARVLWILSRAVRDLHQVMYNTDTAAKAKIINERQLNALASFGTLSPAVTAEADAAMSVGGKVESTRSMGQELEPASTRAKPVRFRRISSAVH